MGMNPRTLRPSSSFTPRSISGLALWLDASASGDLFTTDAGPVVPVNDPRDISGCVLWLDGADNATITASGGLVSQWTDKSASGAVLTASGSARPTLSSTGFNSRQAIVFNGTSTNMASVSPYVATNGLSGMTRIAVCQNATTTAVVARVFSGGSDMFVNMNGSWRSPVDSTGATNFVSSTTFSSANVLPAGVYADVFSSGTITQYGFGSTATVTVNGTIPSTTGTGTPTLHVGSNIGANFFWNGPIAEVIYFNRALTRAELARVEAYLAAKWGISGVHAAATSANDPVGYWRDRSGRGANVATATAANRPLVGSENSHRALTFDGLNDNLNATPSTTVGASAVTHIAVVRNNLTAQPVFLSAAWALNSGNAGRPIERWQSASSNRIYTSDATATDITSPFRSLSDRFVHIMDGQRDGVAVNQHRVREFINGAQIFSVTGASAVWSTTGQKFNIGARDDNGVQYKGNICEVLCYDKILSVSERQRLERYLAAKWGIVLAPQVSNADAQDWIDRVYGNGGTVSAATAAAVNQFCNDIDAASLRDRFFRLNLFCGTGLNACLVPLYVGPTSRGIRFGGTTDTNVGPFVAGDYVETGASGGLTGNGTRYLTTGLLTSAIPAIATGHLSAYAMTGFNAASAYGLVVSFSSGFSGSNYYGIEANAGNTAGTMSGAWGNIFAGRLSATSANGAGVGFVATSRIASDDLRLYRNGSQIGTTQTTPTTPAANDGGGFSVFASMAQSGSISFGAAVRMGGYSIGTGLTAAEMMAYNTAMQAFQTALGRNV